MKRFRLSGLSVVTRILVAVVFAGGVALLALQAIMTSPLSRYYEGIVESNLLLASQLALDRCDESFEKLLSLRLSDEPSMVETMRNDTVQRILSLADSFPGMVFVVFENGKPLPGMAPAGWAEPLGSALTKVAPEAPRILNLGRPYLVHWRYFPIWRWHVVAVLDYKTAIAPLMLAKHSVQLGLLAMGIVLIVTFMASFRTLVARPLKQLGSKASAVAGGDFELLRVPGEDEVSRLFSVFNEMTENLRDQKERTDQAILDLRTSVNQKEILLQEVHHRVRNNLNVIISLLNLRSDTLTDVDDVRAAFEESKNRIRAMALVHGHLYENKDYERVQIDAYVRDLCVDLRRVYDDRNAVQLVFEMADHEVDLNRAIPLGLIINEALTNAYKHAFRGLDHGTIAIILSKTGEECVLEIRDDGVGCVQGFGRQGSLGVLLMNELANQIGGSLRIESDVGTSVTVTFPLAPL